MKENKQPKFHALTSTELMTKRMGLTKKDIKASFLEKLFYSLGRVPKFASKKDLYHALALTIRDRVFEEFVKTAEKIAGQDARAVAYLSAEYLPGPHLANNLLSLGITQKTKEALDELGLDLDEIINQEEEPGLGNGGLGRLASCYVDSLATLSIPSVAYGIRYEFGIFHQQFNDGWQEEYTDKWLHFGNPWENKRPEIVFDVSFGGRTIHEVDDKGKRKVQWMPGSKVRGTAYDTPILGFEGVGKVMRLWSAEAIDSFDLTIYNTGDYYKAVEAKIRSENITKILYPNDQTLEGKELRLMQQYFFVCCSLQDLIRLHRLRGRGVQDLHEKMVIQLNDTHPSIAVAELMRLLMDVHHKEWEEAWKITRQTFAYTNHTLLPEALEKWPISLFERILPRHLEIIYEINHRFIQELREVHQYSEDLVSRMSLIDESGERYIRMSHLATVGSYKVNGVSSLHSDLVKKQLFPDFAKLWPEKFCNVTNGITPRRFLGLSNPQLSELITKKIGQGWLANLDELKGLEEFAEDSKFQQKWREIKLENKKVLAEFIQKKTGVKLDPNMIYDIHSKRIHEYKRQHLKVLHILRLYLDIKQGKSTNLQPTAFIFAGKAAPGYYFAKLIIKLVNSVAELVNNDPDVEDRIKVVFVPNFNVKKAQLIYPAADLSEQISMSGMEASGTGNMKFSLNGALTVGTLDGANVEILEEVGDENFFLFGLNTDQVQETKDAGYHPRQKYDQNQDLQEVLDFLVSGKLSYGDTQMFRPIYDNLLNQDPYLVLEDYQAYMDCQAKIHEAWKDQDNWTRMAILNVARMGKFSSDRSIKDYCETIWRVKPLKTE